MSEYQNDTGHELEWDEKISGEGQFIILEEGDYDFTVTGFERGRFPGSAKIPACKKVVLTLTVSTAEGTANVKYDLIMWSKLDFRIKDLFVSVGLAKRGENFIPPWNRVVGSKGRAHFKPREYTTKDGEKRTVNDVASFYDAVQPQAAPQQSFAAPVQQASFTAPAQQTAAAWQGKF